MNIPENCSECPYTNACHAPHYGGTGCDYKETIVAKTIESILGSKPG